MQWPRDGADWPNREASRFVKAAGLTWHVQILGQGPPLLLVHGTGAATHSWRDLAPILAQRFTVIAPDLPGHGFTSAPPPYRQSLPGMAAALGELMRVLDAPPEIAAGHSAGAAILARMILDRTIAPKTLVSLNGALLPMPGMHGQIFSGVARMLARMPTVPWLFSWRASDPAAVERLIAGTGSRLDARGMELYGRLLRDAGHVGSVLAMMAHWQLDELAAALPKLVTKTVLVAAGNDRAVPPKLAAKLQKLLPAARIVAQPGLGHLSHEEDPAGTAQILTGSIKQGWGR